MKRRRSGGVDEAVKARPAGRPGGRAQETSLRQLAPDEFLRLTLTYSSLLDLAVTTRTYKVERSLSPRLRLLAEDLGRLNAHPRDVIESHKAAFGRMHGGLALGRARVLLDESRLVLLETIGELAAYYRDLLEIE